MNVTAHRSIGPVEPKPDVTGRSRDQAAAEASFRPCVDGFS